MPDQPRQGERHIQITPTPASVPIVRHQLNQFIKDFDLPTRHASEISLAATEACANAVTHAYPTGTTHHVSVAFQTDGRELLTVTVRDDGVGIQSANPSQTVGLGLQLIHSLADTVTITDTRPGTSVRMEFPL